MIEPIPYEERKVNNTNRCHYCDTWVAVKYKINTKELDKVYYGIEGCVYCCKRCAERHYVGNKE